MPYSRRAILSFLAFWQLTVVGIATIAFFTEYGATQLELIVRDEITVASHLFRLGRMV